MSDLDGWKLSEAIGGIAMAVFGWFSRREVERVDTALTNHALQLAELQKDRVTRDDFDELRASLTASIAGGIERLEDNVERRHQENRDDMKEIRDRMDKRWGTG